MVIGNHRKNHGYATNPNHFSQTKIDEENANFFQKVYLWMFLGLLLTAGVAYYLSLNAPLMASIFGNPLLFFGIIIIEFILVGSLAALVEKMPLNLAFLIYFLYAALNGVTFSAIFLLYTMGSIVNAFLVTAGMFGFMSIYGYFTKTDLTKVGQIAFMGLIGIIIASIINIFMKSSGFDFLISIIGVIIFTALTAYDTQKIKEINIIGNEGTEEDYKESIRGALALYLDFINLFLMIIRLMGKRRD